MNFHLRMTPVICNGVPRIAPFKPWALISLAALCGPVHQVLAQEIKIDVPQQIDQSSSNYSQCKVDFDTEWNEAFYTARKQTEILERSIADFKVIRSELENDRIFWGYGPPANSQEARHAAAVLNNVVTATETIEAIAKPFTRQGYNLYRLIKDGNALRKIVQSDSVAEFGYRVCTQLCGIASYRKSLLSIGKSITDGVINEGAWSLLQQEVRQQVTALDSQIVKSQDKIIRLEKELYDSSEADFNRFCLESKPPRAADDGQYQLEAGTKGEFPVLANDADPDGGQLRVISVRGLQPNMGTASVNYSTSASGTVLFQAPENYEGVVELGYTIVDDEGDQGDGRIRVSVTPRAKTAENFVEDMQDLVEGLADHASGEMNSATQSSVDQLASATENAMADSANKPSVIMPALTVVVTQGLQAAAAREAERKRSAQARDIQTQSESTEPTYSIVDTEYCELECTTGNYVVVNGTWVCSAPKEMTCRNIATYK